MKNKIPTRKCLVCKKRFEVKSNSHWICSFNCSKVSNNEVDKKKAELKKTEWRKEKALLKIDTHAKEHKKALQDEINKLSRMIDAKFDYNCIDCGKFMSKETHQIDACHLISRKKNPTLRYNLHNLHSGHNACNVWNESHESSYRIGLVLRYGSDYFNMIEGLPIKYKEIHLSNAEVNDKLILVRKLIRDFNTFNLDSSMMARYLLNKILGIYN